MNSNSAIIKHGSLFSGIGGFDIAAEWCDWANLFHCEINQFCSRILKYYWPHAETIKNVIGYGWKKWKGKIHVLSGGWPCQKYSLTGSRAGNEPLKEEMLRAIRIIRPAWYVLENVYGFITKKFAFEHHLLCQQLEGMGYDVQTFDIDAASCGIPTLERHVWIIAAPAGQRLEGCPEKTFQNVARAKGVFPRSDKRASDGWHIPFNRVCQLGERVPPGLDISSISAKSGTKKA